MRRFLYDLLLDSLERGLTRFQVPFAFDKIFSQLDNCLVKDLTKP